MLREFFSSRYEWGRKKKQTVHRKRGGPLLFFLAEDRKRKTKRAGCILCYLSLHQHEVRRFFSLGPMRGKKGAKLSVFRNQISVESYETRIQGCVHKKKTNLEIIDVGVSLCSNQYVISFMKRITPSARLDSRFLFEEYCDESVYRNDISCNTFSPKRMQ